MIYVVIWLVCALCCGAVAKQKNRTDVWAAVVVGALLGPFGLLIVLCMPRMLTPEEARPRRPCPYCAEMVLRAAVICPHCRSGIETPRLSRSA